MTSSERARVAGEILATYVLVRWWLVRLDFPATVYAARRVRRSSHAQQDATSAALRLGIAVHRTLHRMPLDTRCLVRSLVLTRLLARRGIASTFVIGVRAKPEFAAHAWLERDGVALLPTGPEFHSITEL
jgi:hypothetical protein